jgi:excisionase family DNA binding protein
MKSGAMSTKEVCEVLGISLSTLRRRVRSGELKPLPKAPGQKRAHRLLFVRADIERMLSDIDQCVSSGDSPNI